MKKDLDLINLYKIRVFNLISQQKCIIKVYSLNIFNIF